jgi:5-methylcytosine-specific restriction protein A
MSRREFSAKVMAAAALRANGKCEKCDAKLMTGGYHFDHIIPDAMGGEPTLDNVAVLCKSCHSAKTRNVDVPNIAKAKRRERAHFGIKKPSRFACSRNSRFKKKMNGEVVLR